MTFHATHPSDYDDTCADCAGYTEPILDPRRSHRALLIAAIVVAVLIMLAAR